MENSIQKHKYYAGYQKGDRVYFRKELPIFFIVFLFCNIMLAIVSAIYSFQYELLSIFFVLPVYLIIRFWHEDIYPTLYEIKDRKLLMYIRKPTVCKVLLLSDIEKVFVKKYIILMDEIKIVTKEGGQFSVVYDEVFLNTLQYLLANPSESLSWDDLLKEENSDSKGNKRPVYGELINKPKLYVSGIFILFMLGCMIKIYLDSQSISISLCLELGFCSIGIIDFIWKLYRIHTQCRYFEFDNTALYCYTSRKKLLRKIEGKEIRFVFVVSYEGSKYNGVEDVELKLHNGESYIVKNYSGLYNELIRIIDGV